MNHLAHNAQAQRGKIPAERNSAVGEHMHLARIQQGAPKGVVGLCHKSDRAKESTSGFKLVYH